MTPHNIKNATKSDGTVPDENDIVLLKQELGVSRKFRIVAMLDSCPAIRYQGVPVNDDNKQIGRAEVFSHSNIKKVIES